MDHSVVKIKGGGGIGADGPKIHVHVVSFTTSEIVNKLTLSLRLGFLFCKLQ